MKQTILTIAENRALAAGVYRMRLEGDAGEAPRPGQFINIRLEGCFLRRPISVCDWDPGTGLTVLYKVVGHGTEKMSGMHAGEKLDVLTGLGNGFDTGACPDRVLLLGGGIGIAPLFLLARRLKESGREVRAVLGFNTKDEVFYEEEFRALGAEVTVMTADGSRGLRGFATDAPGAAQAEYVCACGPEPMLRAVYCSIPADGQYSFEERMGCGFGACMGCSCRTVTGYKRICKDGPVLFRKEILWED